MDVSKMTKEEYEEYLDETDLDEEEFEKESTESHMPNNREEQDTFEEAKEFYRRDNGNRILNPSKIFGTIVGIVAVAAHVIHTFVANVFFGKYEQLAIREAFMRGLGKLGEPGEISTKEEAHNAKEQEIQPERQTNQQILEKAIIPNSIPEPACYQVRDNEIEVLNATLNNPDVQHVFALNGYLVDVIPNKDKAFFFEYKDGKVNGTARGFQASEFFTGNLNGMTHAIQEITHIPEIEAAFKSCALRSGMILLSNEEDVKEGLVENKLATVNIKTKYGSDTLSFLINKNNSKQVDVVYNGKTITTIDAERLYKEPFENYKKDLLDSVKIRDHRLQLDKHISVSWDNYKNNLTVYIKDSKLGTFSFTSTKDIQKLADELKRNNVSVSHKNKNKCIQIQPDTLAYTLGILTNPDIKFARTENDMCINPITHTPEQDGKSHIYSIHHERGVELHAYLPTQEGDEKNFKLCGFTSRNELNANSVREIAVCIQEASCILKQIPEIDFSYRRDDIKEKDTVAFIPDKEELTSDLFHGLYEKCRNEIGFGNTVIPTIIPLDELKEAFGINFEETRNQTEKQFQMEPIIFTEKPEFNKIERMEAEEQIENTSLFVPAYDEER